jgi:hypothetical protein
MLLDWVQAWAYFRVVAARILVKLFQNKARRAPRRVRAFCRANAASAFGAPLSTRAACIRPIAGTALRNLSCWPSGRTFAAASTAQFAALMDGGSSHRYRCRRVSMELLGRKRGDRHLTARPSELVLGQPLQDQHKSGRRIGASSGAPRRSYLRDDFEVALALKLTNPSPWLSALVS